MNSILIVILCVSLISSVYFYIRYERANSDSSYWSGEASHWKKLFGVSSDIADSYKRTITDLRSQNNQKDAEIKKLERAVNFRDLTIQTMNDKLNK